MNSPQKDAKVQKIEERAARVSHPDSPLQFWTVLRCHIKMPPLMVEHAEKNRSKTGYQVPGGCLAWGAAFLFLFAILQLSDAEGFLTGVRTYFWTKVPGIVVKNDLEPFHRESGMVHYTVKLPGSDVEVERTEQVYKEWTFGKGAREKIKAWADGYAVGKSVDVYCSSSGETSLGHWPKSYSWTKAMKAAACAYFASIMLIRGINRMRVGR